MKHLEVCQKYFAVRHIFNPLLSVSSGNETLRPRLDITSNRSFKDFVRTSIAGPSICLFLALELRSDHVLYLHMVW